MRDHTLFDRLFAKTLWFIGGLFHKERAMIVLQIITVIMSIVLAIEYWIRNSR